jgi:hypothetical protein
MPGFDTSAIGSVVFAQNVDFSGASLTSGTPQVTANGQLLIGAATAPYIRVATLTPGTGVTITNGPGTITIGLAGGGGAVEHLTGDSGGQLNPDGSNNFTLTLGGILKLANGGTNANLTASNGGIFYSTATAGAILAGTSTANQVLMSGVSSAPAWSTATYPATTTINQLLYSSSANVIGGLATANNGVLTTGTTGIPVITALASNGQLIIGSGSGAPAAATLTPGTGITITNAANSITIAATGGSFAWVDVTTATQTMAIQTGYVTDHTNVTYTLPATAALGDQIRIVGKLGITTIAQNAGQQILMSSASSTVGVSGSIAGTNVGDCVWLVCVTAGASTVWRGESFVGNWTVT